MSSRTPLSRCRHAISAPSPLNTTIRPSCLKSSASPTWKCQSSKRSMATVTSTPPVAQSSTSSRGPTALVFMNMGGPSTTREVGPFLSRLFADADLIPLGRLQPYLGPLIAARRTPKIVKQYTDIGGGSPILKWSRQQAAATCAVLDRTNPETAPHKPYVAFRYADPLTEDTYAELLKDGFGEQGRALAFTQYPQYSCSTTGSSLNEIWKQRQRLEGRGLPREKGIQWSVIDRWPIHPLLVESFAQRIQATLDTYPPERRKDAIILFSAHSLPMSVVNRGDTYPSEVAATVSEVMRRLNHSNPYRLCWQSQVGPSAWLGAQTADTVVNYVKRGHKDLILVPIAFTSDHIETLFEIDQEVIHEADQAGAEGGVRRVESLNGSETFVDCLADVARKHMKGEGGWGGTVGGEMRCSRQMAIRCQGCTSERCLAQKRYFVGEGEGAPAVM